MATFFVLICVFAGGIALGRRISMQHIAYCNARVAGMTHRVDLYKEESAKWRRAAVKLADSMHVDTSEGK